MKIKPHVEGEPNWPEAVAMIEHAKQRGTHSAKWKTVCDGCGNWVDSIYVIVPLTHKRLCKRCACPEPEAKK